MRRETTGAGHPAQDWSRIRVGCQLRKKSECSILADSLQSDSAEVSLFLQASFRTTQTQQVAACVPQQALVKARSEETLQLAKSPGPECSTH